MEHADPHYVDPQLGLPASGHEESDADIHMVVVTLTCLAIGAILVGCLVYGIFRYLSGHPLSAPRPNPMEQTEAQQMPPEPRIEVNTTLELQQLRSSEDQILSTYGWTDKDKGVVRIPIDQAMQMELQKGFPTKPAEKTNGRQ